MSTGNVTRPYRRPGLTVVVIRVLLRTLVGCLDLVFKHHSFIFF